jgi:TonB family protein
MLNGREAMLVLVSVLIASLLPAFSGGQNSNTMLELSLRDQFQGRIVTLRHFYTGSKLLFDEDGNIVGTAKEGSWTTCAKVQITQVKLSNKGLVMKAQRLLLQYDPAGKSFLDIGQTQQISIEVALAQPAERLKSALAKVFLTTSEDLSQLAPECWKLFLMRAAPPSKADLAAALSRESLGYEVHTSAEPGITEPIILRRSIPRYTPEARLGRANGNIVIAAVVDTNGRATRPIIVVPLGLGLDEAAVEEIGKWTFKPAQLNGEAVAMLANIEITFKLYDQPPEKRK